LFILGVAATIVIAICGVAVLVWLVFRRVRGELGGGWPFG
jgi:hypothetical protein